MYYNDFRAKSHQFYYVAQKRGWLKDFDWLIKESTEPYNKKWNYDTCYAEAKNIKEEEPLGKGQKEHIRWHVEMVG